MVITAIFGEVFQIPTIGIHYVDFPVPIPIGSEGNLFAIGRPRGMEVTMAIFGEVATMPAIDTHHMDVPTAIALGNEDNAFADYPQDLR